MLSRKIILTLCFIMSMVTACSAKQKPDPAQQFRDMVPVEMNTQLKLGLWSSDELKNLHPGELIGLMLENIGDKGVVLPQDLGVSLYTYDENEKNWKEVTNCLKYSNLEVSYLLPKTDTNYGIRPIK